MSRTRTARRNVESNPVSLFPFLAVLICTMGALILLLVLIAQSARASAQAKHAVSEINADEVIEQLQAEIETQEVLSVDLQESKRKTAEDVELERAKLATLESNIEKLLADVERTEMLVKELQNGKEGNAKNMQLEELQNKLELQQRALKLSEAELAKLQNEKPNERSYAIVPYRGENGTFRRPIYIECRNDRVIIQPEGIELLEDDFLTAGHPDNPLDTLVRAASLFYTENNLVAEGTRPYPLVLVRPDGIDAYYAVRASIISWGDQFGYELIGQDWKLEFPNPNEALKDRLQQQLTASRERMMPIKQMLMGQYLMITQGTQGVQGGRMQHLEGSMQYEGIDWKKVAETVAKQRQNAMGRSGRTNGGNGNNNGGNGTIANQRGTRNQGSNNGNGGGATYRVNGNGRIERFGFEDDFSDLDDMGFGDSSKQYASQSTTGNHSQTMQGGAGGMSGAINPEKVGNNTPPLVSYDQYKQSVKTQGTGTQALSQSLLQTAPQSKPAAAQPQIGSYKDAFGTQATNIDGGINNGTDALGQSLPGYAASGTEVSNQKTSKSVTQNSAPMTLQQLQQMRAMSNNHSANNNSMTPGVPGNVDDGADSNDQEERQGGMSSSGSTQMCDNTTVSDSMAPMPSLTFENRSNASKKVMPSMPQNWAMRNMEQGSTEIVRPVSVQCYADKIVLKKSGGFGIEREIKIPPHSGVAGMTNEMMNAILDYADTWGAAGARMHWQPELNITVAKDAEHCFEELKDFLRGSGVRISRK